VDKVPCEAELTPVIAGGVYVQVYGSDLLSLTRILVFVVLVNDFTRASTAAGPVD